MTLRLVPHSLVFGEFGCLEPTQPQWLAEKAYWEDYNQRFFRSNGLDYSAADSNVDRWLTAHDRAPYAFMARELLGQMQARVEGLDTIDMVLLAHWLPDLHLGTSVTNFALHHLAVPDGFGFAISDRGCSAPLFAIHCLARYLTGNRRRALLMVMDQKHLLYRSPQVDALDPVNSAAAMVFERDADSGLAFGGYQRTAAPPAQALRNLLQSWDCDPQTTTLIADPELLDLTCHRGPMWAQNPRHLCAAPFAALAQRGAAAGDVMMLCQDGQALTALCLKARTAPAHRMGATSGLVPA